MDQAETKMAIGEHRGGAYSKDASTGAQPIAICWPASSISHDLRRFAKIA